MTKQSHTLSFDCMDDLPGADEIASLARQHHRLTLQVATRLTSHGANSQDAPALFLKNLQEEVRPLLPNDCAVRVGALLRGTVPQERSADGMVDSWSYITVYHTWTQDEALHLAPLIAAAARDYDALATRLMVRLAHHLNDTPENFARDGDHCWQYAQSGQMDEWAYRFHGRHCGFGSGNSKQYVEAAQGCTNETGHGFGVLDSGFFAGFCQTEPHSAPLSRLTRGSWEDWERLFEVAAEHGFLRKVALHHGYSEGYVATPD